MVVSALHTDTPHTTPSSITPQLFALPQTPLRRPRASNRRRRQSPTRHRRSPTRNRCRRLAAHRPRRGESDQRPLVRAQRLLPGAGTRQQKRAEDVRVRALSIEIQRFSKTRSKAWRPRPTAIYGSAATAPGPAVRQQKREQRTCVLCVCVLCCVCVYVCVCLCIVLYVVCMCGECVCV